MMNVYEYEPLMNGGLESAADSSTEDIDEDSVNHLSEKGRMAEIVQASDLQFTEVPVCVDHEKKADEMEKYVVKGDVSVEKWREFALTPGGLVRDTIRKTGWPGLLGLSLETTDVAPSEEELRTHPEFGQVVLDVQRSIKRFPPGIPYEQRVALQEQLTNLILRVITKYPHLRYYQGYHDVAITVLLVVGEDMAFRIMELLSTNHLKDCMEPTMEKSSYLLTYIFPIIRRRNPELFSFMDKSGAGTMFCLPWFLTWFGHSLNHYKDVVRLYDFFLASEPLMPLYMTSVIVLHRQEEVLEAECSMASVHCLLSVLPDDLPFEDLITEAVCLYKVFPPDEVDVEVQEIIRLEKIREKEEAERRKALRAAAARRSHHPPGLRGQLVRLLPSSRLQMVLMAVSVFMGLYAYLRRPDYPMR